MVIFERGFNYSQDGPGNRLVYHLQGCNMNCKWCSNPEGMSITPPIITSKDYIPSEYCDKNAIQDGKLCRDVCKNCDDKHCIKEKNTKLYVKAYTQSVDEVVSEILSSKMMFFNGGGVTFTGGEVTLQLDEVIELFKKLKDNNIHTALETNATHPSLNKLLPYVDYFIMDLKHYSDEKHIEFTGVPIKNVINNLRDAVLSGRQVLLRIPLIAGINTENPQGFTELLKGLEKENLEIELLKYHEYGKEKWLLCGFEYALENGHITNDTYNNFKNEFIKQGFNIIKT